MSRFVFILSGLLCAQLVSAQFCGTNQDAIFPILEANLKSPAALERGAVKYIPITFHMVASASGAGRVQVENVLKQLANFNAQYADQDVVFYIDRLNEINNDAVYNTPGSAAARTQMTLKKDNNSINIFICNTADDGSGPGVTLAYYDPQGDWIVTRKNEVNISSSTLAHEVGHFFSLAHTHSGWDCVPFTLADYTNPVNVDFTQQCEGGGGSMLIELHNRSNCATAGDRLCDTPEDYNLGLFFQNNCAQNTQIKDKNGEIITPMTNNFMSYYTDCETHQFTPQQKSLMNTDYFTARRAYIRTGHVPNTTPVTEAVEYNNPINGQLSNGTSGIVLDWEDVPGANQYLIIYDRFAQFTFSPEKAIVTSSEFTIPVDLPAGVTYYWKVWPFNESQTGAMYSATQNFVVGTGTGVNDIKEIQEYVLHPNPVEDQINPVLTLVTNEAFEGVLNIADASGRRMKAQIVSFPSGSTDLPIDVEGLPAGIYFMIISSGKGNLVERLIILN